MRRVPAPNIVVRSTLMLTIALAAAACGGDDEQPAIEPIIAHADVPAPTTTDTATGVIEPPAFVVPENVSYETAESAFGERRYGEAAALFEVYVTSKPANPWGHYMLGLSAWKSGDRERAVSAFETSLTLDPSHVKSMLNLGRVLLEIGRPDDALKQIESARAIDSGSADVHRLLGRTYGELRRVEEAIESYEDAIVIDPTDAWSMNNMGFLLINEGRYEEALLPLARAVELRGDVAVFRNNLGVALERTGRFTLAVEQFRKALEADSTYAKASVSLARVEQLKEKPETVPVDLGELARKFEELVEIWKLENPLEHAC